MTFSVISEKNRDILIVILGNLANTEHNRFREFNTTFNNVCYYT